MLANKHLILFKIETGGYGVDAVPVPATDAILVEKLSINLGGAPNERNPISGSMSPWPSAKPSIGPAEIKFSVEVKGSGVVDTPVEAAPLLRACARGQTINAGVSTVHAPVSTGFESGSLYVYPDGLLHKFLGCYGNAELIFEAGKPARYEFTIQAKYSIPTNVAIPSGAVYDTTIPPVVESIALTIDSYVAIISKLQINLGNVLFKRPDVNSPFGLFGVGIRREKVMGSIDPEAVDRATYDYWQKMQDAAQVALSATVGNTAGNRLVMTASKVIYDPFAWGEREGQRIYEIPLRLVRNAGDDEMILTFN